MAAFLDAPNAAADSGLLLNLSELSMLANAPRVSPTAGDPARQWWNFAAKKAAGERIAREVQPVFAGHHNDAGDAMRHAVWSQRMADEIGPVFSGLAGLYHEGTNVGDDLASWGRYALSPDVRREVGAPPSLTQTLSESGMDLRNNAEGVAAALRHRPIDPANLQTRPVIRGYR